MRLTRVITRVRACVRACVRAANSMFQASLALAVLAAAYGFHAKHQPFVNAAAQAEAQRQMENGVVERRQGSLDRAGAPESFTARRRRRTSIAAVADVVANVGTAAVAEVEALIDFNVLETVLLCSSTAVLVGGMMFESSQLPVDSAGYGFLTFLVATIMVCSVGLFIVLLAIESRRTCRKRLPPGQLRKPDLVDRALARAATLRTAVVAFVYRGEDLGAGLNPDGTPKTSLQIAAAAAAREYAGAGLAGTLAAFRKKSVSRIGGGARDDKGTVARGAGGSLETPAHLSAAQARSGSVSLNRVDDAAYVARPAAARGALAGAEGGAAGGQFRVTENPMRRPEASLSARLVNAVTAVASAGEGPVVNVENPMRQRLPLADRLRAMRVATSGVRAPGGSGSEVAAPGTGAAPGGAAADAIEAAPSAPPT